MNALNRKFRKLEDLQFLKSDLDLRQELLESVEADRTKQGLASAAGFDDGELIERLFRAGFTAETLPALSAAPIALIAWGSGQVTREELTVAMQAILDSEVAQQHAAIAKFQSWMETRPSEGLFELWRDFTQARPGQLQSDAHDAERMLQWLTQVASSSGGILGFGAICAGERAIIDRVRTVLRGKVDNAAEESMSPMHEAA